MWHLTSNSDACELTDAPAGFNEPADWTHLYLGCLPLLPVTDAEGQLRMAAALKHAARQQMLKHRSLMRQAAVGEWEMVLRATDSSATWRITVKQGQGKCPASQAITSCSPSLGINVKQCQPSVLPPPDIVPPLPLAMGCSIRQPHKCAAPPAIAIGGCRWANRTI